MSSPSQDIRPNLLLKMWRKLWRPRNFVRGAIVCGTLVGIATWTWGVDEAASPSNVGLRGIFPNEPPEVLSEEEFARLDGNWQEWSKGAAAAVADFYKKLESTDVAGQRAALGVLKQKLDVMKRALYDPAYAQLHDPLNDLHSRLSQRIELAEATLDTLSQGASYTTPDGMAHATQELSSAVGRLESNLGAIPDGTLWVPYIKSDTVKGAIYGATGDDATITAAKESLAKLDGRSSLPDAEQRAFLDRPMFRDYESALKKYLDAAARKSRETLTTELRNQFKDLAESLDDYSATRSVASATKVRASFSAIRRYAADGGQRLSGVLQKNLFNYNLRITATEDFLNRLASDSRIERGPVIDCILGASVSGNQCTVTSATIDLKPSPSTICFDLNLVGRINSNTQGVTPQATVYTAGDHHFHAAKEVNFDGRFATASARIGVNAQNTTTGMSVRFGNVPILGRIVQGIAARKVAETAPEARAIAASRVREQVLPRFNQEVDRAFGDAGSKLETELNSGLRATGLYPDAQAYSSTDSSISVSTRLMGAGELGASSLPPVMVMSNGATMMLHESAINNTIDRMGLAGKTLSEAQLREKIQSFLSTAFNRPITLDPPPTPASDDKDDEGGKGPKDIIFEAEDPVRVRVEGGEMKLVIRAGFKQDEGKDDIPAREITVPLTFQVAGNKINIARGSVKVTAADGGGGGGAINVVVRKKIQTVLPDRTVDGKVELKGTNKVTIAHVQSLKLVDGWVVVGVN